MAFFLGRQQQSPEDFKMGGSSLMHPLRALMIVHSTANREQYRVILGDYCVLLLPSDTPRSIRNDDARVGPSGAIMPTALQLSGTRRRNPLPTLFPYRKRQERHSMSLSLGCP